MGSCNGVEEETNTESANVSSQYKNRNFAKGAAFPEKKTEQVAMISDFLDDKDNIIDYCPDEVIEVNRKLGKLKSKS